MTDRPPWDVKRCATLSDHVVPVARQPELLADRQAALRRQLARLRKALPPLAKELSQPQTRAFAGREPFELEACTTWVPSTLRWELGTAGRIPARIERILSAPTVRRHLELDDER